MYQTWFFSLLIPSPYFALFILSMYADVCLLVLLGLCLLLRWFYVPLRLAGWDSMHCIKKGQELIFCALLKKKSAPFPWKCAASLKMNRGVPMEYVCICHAGSCCMLVFQVNAQFLLAWVTLNLKQASHRIILFNIVFYLWKSCF